MVFCGVGQSASCTRAPAARKTSASPTRRRKWSPARPPSARKAATAISGPMPPGSPLVIRIGPSCALAGLDIGFTPQVAQIPSCLYLDLRLVELLLDLILGRDGDHTHFRHGFVATHDDLDGGPRTERG